VFYLKLAHNVWQYGKWRFACDIFVPRYIT
jgi:hypothetical protein